MIADGWRKNDSVSGKVAQFCEVQLEQTSKKIEIDSRCFIYVMSATHSFGGAGPELLDSLSQCGMPEAKPREVVSAGVS